MYFLPLTVTSAKLESKAADWGKAIHEAREDAVEVSTDGSMDEEGMSERSGTGGGVAGRGGGKEGMG